ncbi:S8 family peptidase [Herbidospora cretacea]|uniref:S8 family peptidase n=1 Tax=Herbidospora cretacea TaxID=28444 RepID=UPI0007C71E91|nr:S8 family peptidase [Herbidospora cretacea]
MHRIPRVAALLAATALAGASLAAPVQARTAMVVGTDNPGAIPGSYIVVLKPTADVRAQSRDLAAENGGQVKNVYNRAIKGFSINATAKEARALAADPDVAYVEQDAVVTIDAEQANPPSWGLDRIDQRALPLNSRYTYTGTGAGVTAYIIDTGILTTHQDFGGRAVSGKDFVSNDNDATDCNGHGTHVAGTVGGTAYGVAKQVKLVGVRVLDCAGRGSNSGVIAGIDWVTANAAKPAVANMSLGGSASTAVDTAVKNSIKSGVTYGLAAGNSSTNACSSSPSRVPEGITVGATAKNDARASYSNYGDCLDVFAPGTDITSAWYTSPTAKNTISGTSMATPHVVGAAALILSGTPTATPAQIRDTLVKNGVTGVVGNPGSGSPNVLLNTSGGTAPSPSASPSPSPSPTASPTVSPTVSPSSSATPTPTASPSPTTSPRPSASPTPTAPAKKCVTATNNAHVSAGRAYVEFFFLVYAEGSNDYLGLTGTTQRSLQETRSGYWDLVSRCA